MKFQKDLNIKPFLLLLFCGAVPAVCPLYADPVSDGTATLDVRYRYERVEQSNFPNTAGASTVRTRLGYETAPIEGFSVFLEMEDVHKVAVADYTTPSAGALNTTVGPKEAGYPVVADPIGTELNQSYLQYKSGTSIIRYGRQRIIRGSARFVGNVGWRQNEQTFDALSVECSCVDKFNFYAAYISNRNTITMTDIDMDTVLLDASYEIMPGSRLSGYYYDVQVDNAAPFWETIGLQFKGRTGEFGYAAEYAVQEQANGAEPDYLAAELTYGFDLLSAGLGFEVLGSDLATGFATPLATLHKFNGWADQFLSTPADGLEDVYFKASASPGDVTLALIYHDFSADTGGVDYGSELDLLAVKPVAKALKLGAKYANYSSGDTVTGLPDVEKFWLWAEYKF